MRFYTAFTCEFHRNFTFVQCTDVSSSKLNQILHHWINSSCEYNKELLWCSHLACCSYIFLIIHILLIVFCSLANAYHNGNWMTELAYGGDENDILGPFSNFAPLFLLVCSVNSNLHLLLSLVTNNKLLPSSVSNLSLWSLPMNRLKKTQKKLSLNASHPNSS